ncbi:Transcriptional regulatory protein sin3 [Rhizina undulata]
MADDSPPLRPRTSNLPQEAISPSPVASTDGPTALPAGINSYIMDQTAKREFTELVHSFTQGKITSEVFVDKAASFIGGDTNLMDELKKFVALEDSYERADDGKENCWVSEALPLDTSPAARINESTNKETTLFAGIKNFTGSIGTYNEFTRLFRSFIEGETAKEVLVDKFKSILGRDINLMDDLKGLLVHLEDIYERGAKKNAEAAKQPPTQTSRGELTDNPHNQHTASSAGVNKFTGDTGIYNKFLKLFSNFAQGETTAEVLVDESASLVGRDIKIIDHLEEVLVRLKESYEQTNTAGDKENVQTSKRLPQAKVKKAIAIVLTDGPTETENTLFIGARNFIGDSEIFKEFLKPFRSFAQGEIPAEVLLDKSANFIGGDIGLMRQLRRFVGWEGSYERIGNSVVNVPKQRPPKTITLQMIPTMGLSYKLKSKSDATKKCSGRDELCDEVLNDMWGSKSKVTSKENNFYHPEKNQHEEELFDVEDERFEYDCNLKKCGDAIGLLESLSENIADMHMTAQEKEEYKMTHELPGNISVFKWILSKVYGEHLGIDMLNLIYTHPVSTIPGVLKSLKEKELQWKRETQEKQEQWRERNAKAYWKSLDPRGIQMKEADRKLFAMENFVEEIQPKQKEREIKPKKFTLKYSFEDFGIVLDACRLMAVALEHSKFSHQDRDKIAGFINIFIPLFFGIPSKNIEDAVNGAMQKPLVAGSFSYDPLRDVLQQGNNESGAWIPRPIMHFPNKSHNGGSLMNEPMQKEVYPLYCNESVYGFFRVSQILYSRLSKFKSYEEESVLFENLYPTKEHKVVKESNESNLRGLDPDEGFRYTEESHVRGSRSEEPMNAWGIPMDIEEESNVRGMNVDNLSTQESVNPIPTWSMTEKRSICHLKLEDEFKVPHLNDEDVPTNKLPKENIYSQALELCEKFLKRRITTDEFEENLRKICVMKGFLLYSIRKLLELNLSLIQGIVRSNSGKIHPHQEQTVKILLMFQRERDKKDLMEKQELMAYRKRVEGTLGTEDLLFNIEWHEPNKEATIPDVPDVDEKLNSYIESYMMSSPTEGIPLDRCRKVFLRRNLPGGKDFPEASAFFEPEPMRIRIDAQSYGIIFERSWDFLLQSRSFRTVKGSEKLNRSKELRQKRWNREVLGKAPWMEGLSDAEKCKKVKEWENFVTVNHLTALD